MHINLDGCLYAFKELLKGVVIVETESTVTVESIANSVDFSSLGTTYLQIAGIAIPVIVGILAAKKGIRWLLGFIKRA